MVQIPSLLKAIPILFQLSVSVSGGLPRPANGLAVRQSTGLDDLPTACQSPCDSMNDILNTDMSLSEFCTDTVASVFLQCLSCIAPISSALQDDAQEYVIEWDLACNGNLTLSSGTTNGTTGGSSGGSMGGSINGTTGSIGGMTVGPSGTSTSSILPTTSGTSSSSGNPSNPSSVNTGVAVGLKTGGITMGVVAAIVGAFVSL